MSSVAVSDNAQQDIPEPDRLEGFVHPRYATQYFGHEDAQKELLEGFTSQRLHHAWLMAGPEGVGKATLAYRFARFLLAQSSPSLDAQAKDLSIPAGHRIFGQVAALAHPNLLLLRRPWLADRKRLAGAITVSEARRLRHFFGHTAGAGQWRVVIIDRADELNAAAANALLKNLEEPPARCVFLLVCSAPGRLPVTIRSRCRTLRFSALENADLEAAVLAAYRAAECDPPDIATLHDTMPLAQGSARRALQLLESGGATMHARLIKLMGQLPGLDHQAIHKLADELTSSGADSAYELFFELAGESVARIVGHAATGVGALGAEAEIAQRLRGPRALAQFAGLWETIQREKAEADALNLDRKNLVLGTFFRLEEAARQALR
ncbi:MAG: DNA polymerase III subunit delta' [Alphaproteobacteria bacterium]